VHADLEGMKHAFKTVCYTVTDKETGKTTKRFAPQMCMVSASFGREDGSSGSIWTDDPREALHWYIKNLTGKYKGRRQVVQGFHFTWDSSVLARDFDPDGMELIHKAGARKLTPLCGKHWHDPGDDCKRMHRYDPKDIELVITEGGETDLIAWDPKSELAIAITPKRRMYIEWRPHGDRYNGWKAIDIHDVGGAFVGGLEKVIDRWQPDISDEQRAAIAWGKEHRKKGFANAAPAQIMNYSEAECVAAALTVRKMLDMIAETTGVRVKEHRLFGSGSVAAAMFGAHDVPTRMETHSSADKIAGIPVNRIPTLTYFGGEIASPVVGIVRGWIEQDDINSAYPSEMFWQPCMRSGHGKWKKHHGHLDARGLPPEHAVGHVLVSWDISHSKTSAPPFNVRLTTMATRMPLTGYKVWVPLAQYRAALAEFPDDVLCHDAVWWVPSCDCPPPFAWMKPLYYKRLNIKADMKKAVDGSPEWHRLNVQQEAIKLVLNSCYGKLAQRRPEPGRWTNLHYASNITGGIRAMMITESWRIERTGGVVVYRHTDCNQQQGGEQRDDSKEFGGWGREKPSRDQLIVQPGLAFSLAATLDKEGLPETGKTATRGCSAGAFVKAAHAWAKTTDFTQPPAQWPVLVITQERMVSRRLANHQGNPEQAGCFLPHDLDVTIATSKRDFDNARLMPGQQEAWIVPPPLVVPTFMVATLDDLDEYQTQLARRMAEGEFDDEDDVDD
jgi:hypothetical protein